MYKIKIFAPVYQQAIQEWLIDHQKIQIISTNLTSNDYGSMFSILYIEVEDDHNFICNGYGISNCVSHATRNAVDITRSCEIIGGQREDFVTRGATEGIYGSRGHGGQGMSCSVAANTIN